MLSGIPLIILRIKRSTTSATVAFWCQCPVVLMYLIMFLFAVGKIKRYQGAVPSYVRSLWERNGFVPTAKEIQQWVDSVPVSFIDLFTSHPGSIGSYDIAKWIITCTVIYALALVVACVQVWVARRPFVEKKVYDPEIGLYSE